MGYWADLWKHLQWKVGWDADVTNKELLALLRRLEEMEGRLEGVERTLYDYDD